MLSSCCSCCCCGHTALVLMLPDGAGLLPMQTCRSKCLEDLQSTTRYVTWSLHTKSRSSLKAMLSKVGPMLQGAIMWQAPGDRVAGAKLASHS